MVHIYSNDGSVHVNTGAIEMAMWNLLGSRPVEILAWEVFGNDWKKDILEQLKIKDSNTHVADFGKIPDLSKVNFNNDVCIKHKNFYAKKSTLKKYCITKSIKTNRIVKNIIL